MRRHEGEGSRAKEANGHRRSRINNHAHICIRPRAFMYGTSLDFQHSGKRTDRWGFFPSKNYLYYKINVCLFKKKTFK